MRSAAAGLLTALDDQQHLLAARPFADDAARRWLEYRPRSRPGACIAELSGAARKAAHLVRYEGRLKHGGGKAPVPGAADPDEEEAALAQFLSREPTAEMAAQLAEIVHAR